MIYAKNYLHEDELDTLNMIVSLYLDYAELMAKQQKPKFKPEKLKTSESENGQQTLFTIII